MKHSGSVKVTYLDCNSDRRTITLHEACWTKVRGVAVLKGHQSIRGRMVNRTIAGSEIVENGIRHVSIRRKDT
jgi:hypothetical protein